VPAPDRPDKPYMRGILSEPLDLDGDGPRVKRPPPLVAANPGLDVAVRGTPIKGIVVACDKAFVTIRDDHGRDHKARLRDGAFDVGGKKVTLVRPKPTPGSGSAAAPTRTASGSVAVPGAR